MKCVYPACFYEELDGSYSVVLPDFPLATCGSDLADAMYMASDAAAGRIIMALENGEALPAVSKLDSVVPQSANEFTSLVLIDTDSCEQNYATKPTSPSVLTAP
ncbi:MAG: hypothetical protein Ta2A_21650 [Treponemataceae bacterium]|nr:MAG: hypothetical protein Ta2A_21650 [Treponemataceae bacterium]